MCGISGYWGPFSRELLPLMNGVQAHRGPDDDGLWYGDGVALGHRRLAIMDLSPRGHQPMATPDGAVRIVFNGEIYNFRELRRQLEATGVTFRSETDTEVLLHAYRAWGPTFVERLNGIFAFALWDDADKVLWLARDGMGVKPLYVAEVAAGLLFASELKALLQCTDVSRELNPSAILAHTAFLWSPAPWTCLRGVQKVEPGHLVEVRGGKIRSRRTFYKVPYRPLEEMSATSPQRLPYLVHDALKLAVRRQLMSDVPLGAYLSGGLDSSAICAFAAREMGSRRLQCYTVDLGAKGIQEGTADDLAYARKVARALDVDLHVLEAKPGFADRLPSMVWHLDEPQGDLAAVNTWIIAELARSDGIKVMLSGAGGDDLFGGYRRHISASLDGLWSHTPAPMRQAIARGSSAIPSGIPLVRRLKRAFRDVDLDETDRLVTWFTWTDQATLRDLMGPRLREGTAWEDVVHHLQKTVAPLPSHTPALERMLALETRHFLADHNLNYADKMGMATGLEIRVPFLDPDLVNLACQIPPDLKVRRGVTKWALKKAMEGVLPHDVIYRPKAGFGVPLRRWFVEGSMPAIVAEALAPEVVARRGLFDPQGVQRLLQRTVSGATDGAYVLMSIATIEHWCRQFVDPPRPVAPAQPWLSPR